MRGRALAGPVIRLLAADRKRQFEDEAAWQCYLERLGITALDVASDKVSIAAEGALWSGVTAHGLLRQTVILSDDAGQFAMARHALCWVRAERLVHKLDAFSEHGSASRQHLRGLIWRFSAGLRAYRTAPTPHLHSLLRARFDRIFHHRAGFATLDRLLQRLHANKPELLLLALDRPEIPLHTNGSEDDIRYQVSKRDVTGSTKSAAGRGCRDTFLGLAKTCRKLGVAFWEYPGDRLAVPATPLVPYLPELVRCRGHSA